MSNSTAVLTSLTSDSTVIETTTALDPTDPGVATTTTDAAPTTDAGETSPTVVVSTTFASSEPESTEVFTSTQIVTPSAGDENQQPQVTTIVRTSTRPGTTVIGTTQRTEGQTAGATDTSGPTALPNDGGDGDDGAGGGGLSTAATTAIAVVIPVVVVALLVGLGIWFWRKRKSKKSAAEQRQKEMEDYSYNPNGDPTLPAIGSDAGGTTQMAEDHSSGYRGWGAAAGGGMASNRKQSTTLSAGNTHDMGGSGAGSDYGGPANQMYAGYGSQTSPSHGNMSDGHSGDPLVHNNGGNRTTMDSDDIGDLGGAPVAGTAAAGGIRRGPSNASSAYSAGARSDDEPPPMPGAPGQAYGGYDPNRGGYGYGGNGYTQAGPYGDGSYGGTNALQGDMPVVRDVSARRNTRIQPGGNYGQGNSGIAQNF